MEILDIKRGQHLARCARNRKQPRYVQARRNAAARRGVRFLVQGQPVERAMRALQALLAKRDERNRGSTA